jgi:two-component system sensor histidine kinase VanS
MTGVAREPGLSVRVKLTLSYAGFLVLTGASLLAVVWLFLLRYVPDRAMLIDPGDESSLTQGVFPIRSRLLGEFAPRAAAVMAVLLVVGLVGGWFLAGRMLAPLNRITDATRRAASGSLSHRIRLEGRDDEFRELADAFDGMLARLEAHVRENQRFAANASHELRTPLAITQALLEVARNDPARAEDELIERLHAVNARAIGLTEALLVLSRADQRTFDREPVDLTLVVEEAVETLLPLAEEHHVTVQWSGRVATAVGSSALLLQLVTNLLQNAIVHNLPEHGTASIHTATDRRDVILAIENTGALLDPATVTTLTEPFQRDTERVRRDHEGVGLGLAIVASIVDAHDGSLTLEPRPDGGLRAIVRLPRASDEPEAAPDRRSPALVRPR